MPVCTPHAIQNPHTPAPYLQVSHRYGCGRFDGARVCDFARNGLGLNICGLKWCGSSVDNREKGLLLALMSVNLISGCRTAVVPAVGVRYLAGKDVHTVGIIGLGVMNKMTLCSFLMDRPDIETVKVKGRGRRSLESYVDYIHKNFPSIKNMVVADIEEGAIRDSDLPGFRVGWTPSRLKISRAPTRLSDITISRTIDSVPSMLAYAQR